MRCAAFELPFEDGESFGSLPADEVDAVLDHLAAHRVVNRSGGRSHWMSESYPAGEVSLRRVHSENFVVIDTTRDKIIAEVDFDSVQTTLHTHAIYTVDGRPHEVVQLDYDNHKAYVRPVEPDYFTDAMTYAKVEVLDVEASAPPLEVLVEHGEVSVTRKIVGFKKIKLYTHENVGYGDVVLPELTLHTSAWWFTVPRALLAELPYQPADLVDALVGIGHALQYVCSMAVMCDPRDLGRCVGDKSAEAYAGLPAPGDARSPQRHAIQGALGSGADPFQAFDPTVFIYESLPGGVGMSPKLFDNHRLLLERTRALLAACPCESGCPSCIGPMPEDLPHAKQAPLDLLDRILRGLGA